MTQYNFENRVYIPKRIDNNVKHLCERLAREWINDCVRVLEMKRDRW